MSNLNGQMGELSFTVTVKRKETGKEETYNLVGYVDEEKLKEIQHGGDTFNSSKKRSD
ncbi:MAG: hypothetical protein WC733_03485 [Methylophilus sp.]|jgi:hypothetical protein